MSKNDQPQVPPQVTRRVDFVLADVDGGKAVIDINDLQLRERIRARALAFAASWLRTHFGDQFRPAVAILQAGADGVILQEVTQFDPPTFDATRPHVAAKSRHRPRRYARRQTR